jgi:CRISP-associated protein Cas1
MQLVLDTLGLVVKVRNRRFHIIMRRDPKMPKDEKSEQRFISPEKISSIAVTSDCLFSTAALRLAIENEIPVYLFSETGDIAGKLWSPYFVGLASLRRAQALWHETNSPYGWVHHIIALKIAGQTEHLHKLPDTAAAVAKLASVQKQLVDSKSKGYKNLEVLRSEVLNLEAQAARAYWPMLADACPDDWHFKERSHRPAQDPFNAALNYLYGMLYNIVEGAVFAAGLDPYMGMLHAEEYDRPALTFDLIEPFRPWVDALLLEICHSGRLDIRHFEPRDGGWWAAKTARAVLIPAFNDFVLSDYTTSNGDTKTVKNHIHALAAQLAHDIRTWYENRKPNT